MPQTKSPNLQLLERMFLAFYQPTCFYHFTDTRNLGSIRACEGLLSMQALAQRGVAPAAPGGDDHSRATDARKGMDRYVHLCLFDQNPMEWRARQDGRIHQSVFLQIEPEVLLTDGVRFTSAMANSNGVQPLSVAEAMRELDFHAVYREMDLSDAAQRQRVMTARKYELLVPDIVPARHIRNLWNG